MISDGIRSDYRNIVGTQVIYHGTAWIRALDFGAVNDGEGRECHRGPSRQAMAPSSTPRAGSRHGRRTQDPGMQMLPSSSCSILTATCQKFSMYQRDMVHHACSRGPNGEVYVHQSAPMREWTKELVSVGGKLVKRGRERVPEAFDAGAEILSHHISMRLMVYSARTNRLSARSNIL